MSAVVAVTRQQLRILRRDPAFLIIMFGMPLAVMPLMREALNRAWQAGHARVSLTVHPENPAVPLYERCGFNTVEIRRGYHLMVATRP